MAIFQYPWRGFFASSLAASYLLVSQQSHWWKPRFVSSFFLAWAFQTFAWTVWVVILWPKLFSPLRSLPEPAGGSWWNGHFKRILAEPSGIPMREWVATVPNDGVMRYLGMVNSERVLVTGPKALSEVLVTKNYHFEKPASLRYNIGRLLGVGVLLAEGDEHKIQRKNLMPAFAFRHVKDLYPVFWRKTREVVQAMTSDVLTNAAGQPASPDVQNADKSAVIEVGNWASRVTLDIIGLAGLGRDFGAIKDQNSELNETYRHVFQANRQAQILGLLTQLLPGWFISALPVKHNENINVASQYIRSVCRSLIREKKLKIAGKEQTDHDILSVALESGGFSDEDLVDQLMTFLAAGHETTASAMTWAIYMLARFPEIQERLRKEVREYLPSIDSDVDITSLDIDHMPYLNAVCNEVLRYYAPVPVTIRVAARETEILGHKIPKGVRVVLAPWATNFDKSLWGPDAHEFNPERWMSAGADDRKAASGGATSNYAYMTFLHGPRSCIGQAFAKAEFACILAGWVGRFAFELKNKEEMDESKILIKGGVTARPARGMYVHATVVDGW
ncbi:putative cytochrome p450 97b3 [Rosellinia necatrix]|uniref:Putative cytochrome p450 97b3 n=1 Tax=Rosellinia necatrix TaxID=77044 RepID=A0A1W2TAZ1_ROSNE|nr:putative cytochrome p450 97b3 [Rosellinia necatrix]